MKYYGFKFEKSVAEKSKINRNVGTWIGLVGTALFLVSATLSGGFKGPMLDGLFLTIAYPALLWFLSLLGIQHQWATILIILLSVFLLVIFAPWFLYQFFLKDHFNIIFFLLNIFNAGNIYFASKPDSSGLD
ncbi:MAG: hypothetical protein Q9M92_15885 [Enterobacterales bacterium]|nr:hypothetical protein [Enterobacterales bacterium]